VTAFPSYVAVASYSLPPYSLQVADDVPGSVQRQALDWFLLDPDLATYSAYRLRQRYILAVFYYSLGGMSWIDNTNWLSYTNECGWFELACNIDHVVSIEFYNSNGLAGSIPSEIVELTDLTVFEVARSTLVGTIPTYLFQMPNMEVVGMFCVPFEF
jgi:hypothetical protein